MVDSFSTLSSYVHFSHEFGDQEDWVSADETSPDTPPPGTNVYMELSNRTARTWRKIFDEYASPEGDYGFTRTVIPVRLAQYGDDKLVSRSQAKRMLARVDRFKTVVLNFEGVKTIGQAFADEVFRVFPSEHPDIELAAIRAVEQVQQMISRAEGALAEQKRS